ncbi:MAG: AAA family ATPase [Candidatus Rokubacteria bacterium]|nr:AAA family ATPase [Candidatus Rokubacteria bacterium]
MLTELRIRNLAVVEDVALVLGPGFTVLTGETGAGKSILIDAILLMLGARAQPELVRTGEAVATVEARFEPPALPGLGAVLADAGHALAEGQLLVKRELARTGRSRVIVNDSAATVGLLERAGGFLVELHGQHEHQRLLEPAHQLGFLDRFAGVEELVERVGALAGRWTEEGRALARLAEEIRERARSEDLYRFQLSEIDAVAPVDGEEAALRGERLRLQHAERIVASLGEVLGLLHEDTHAAGSRLARAQSLLRDLGRLELDVGVPATALDAAGAHLEEAVIAVRGLRDRTAVDPGRLEEVDARLDALARLKRKYGATIEDVRRHREETREALDRLERHESLAGELERRVRAAA